MRTSHLTTWYAKYYLLEDIIHKTLFSVSQITFNDFGPNFRRNVDFRLDTTDVIEFKQVKKSNIIIREVVQHTSTFYAISKFSPFHRRSYPWCLSPMTVGVILRSA